MKAPRALVFSLPPNLLKTWLRIRVFDWDRGCTASLTTLAGGTASSRQLRRNVRELEARGLVRAEHREGGTMRIFCLGVDLAPIAPLPRADAADQAVLDVRVQGAGRQGPPKQKKAADQDEQQPCPADAPRDVVINNAGMDLP